MDFSYIHNYLFLKLSMNIYYFIQSNIKPLAMKTMSNGIDVFEQALMIISPYQTAPRDAV